MKKLKASALLCVLLLAAAAFFPALRAHSAPHSSAASRKSASPHRAAQASATLFPELDESTVSAITILTPDCSYHFLCDDPQAVSVNGQRADGEVFRTLLEQIAELPVDTHAAFAPQRDRLLLTLTVSSGQAQHTARFYADGKDGEMTHIVAGPENAPQYRQTGGWRVGTLVMTCEGTRILDALGNETPAAQ